MSLKGVWIILLALVLNGCTQVSFDMADGQKNGLDTYSGQWLLINYWAVWCKPCVEEIPELNAVNQRDHVTVLGYNFDRKQGESLTAEARALGVDFGLVVNEPGPLFEQATPAALPATMVIGPDGEFRRWLTGPQTQEALLAQLDEN